MDKRYEKIKLFLTGYGAFQGIKDNPTQKLVRYIEDNKKDFETKTTKIKATTIYEVTVKYVKENLPALYKKIKNKSNRLNIIIHFGLDSNRPQFNLEEKAKNKISEFPYEPKVPIDPKYPDELLTNIKINKIIEELPKDNFHANISHDAGTYLCNYIYFNSLKEFQQNENTKVLFIHVPTFENYSFDIQRDFVKELIAVLEKIYLEVKFLGN